MNSRDRVLASMMHEEPDCVPVFELGINYPVIKGILGYEGKLYSLGQDKPSLFAYQMEDEVKARHKAGVDVAISFLDVGLRKWVDNNTYMNTLGWLIKIKSEVEAQYSGPGVRDYEEFLNLPMDPDNPSWIVNLPRVVKEAEKYNMAVFGVVTGVLCDAFLAFGYNLFLPMLYKEPDLAKKIMSRYADLHSGIVRQMAECGVDAIICGDDIAFKGRLFVSPEIYRRMVMPLHRQITSVIKKAGLPAIFHTDGYICQVIDDLISVGFDGLHPLEPMAGMDIGLVKEKWGDKLFLMGNIDCSQTLTIAPLNNVIKETREAIRKASPGGGYMIASSNSLHNAINVENYLTMVKTAKRYGRYLIE